MEEIYLRKRSISDGIGRFYFQKQNSRIIPFLLMLPALFILVVFFISPILTLLVKAFHYPTTNPGEGFTLINFTKLFTDYYYLNYFLRSFGVGLITAILTLIFGYPFAVILTKVNGKRRDFLIMLLVAPLYTSIVVRVYAWMVILGKAGIINLTLQDLGLIRTPLKLMYNTTGVIIGLFHVFFAFMVLSIYSVLVNINKSYAEAAMNLGANKIKVFLTVTFPLSLPGVLAGSLLVFILSMGAFVVPAFLGGRKSQLISNAIYTIVIDGQNWPFGAAIALVLMVVAVLITTFYTKMLSSAYKG